MPTVTDTEVDGYAHCTNARCPGNNQERVRVFRRNTERTYREMGGDAPGVEMSWVTFHIVDPAEAACPHCGKSRDITGQARIEYDPMSGHDPMGLLGVPGFNPARQHELRAEPMSDPERDRLEAQNRELIERLEKLEAKSDAVG